MKIAHLLLVAALCLGTSGCLFDGKKTAATVPAPPPAPQPAAQQAVPALPPLPVATATPEPPPPAPPTVAEKPEPPPAPPPAQPAPQPKPVARRKPSPIPAAASNDPPPAPSGTTATPSPAPELREIISGDQRRQYESEFRQDVGRAGSALKQAATRPLNAGQRETVARIQTFLAQANSARDNDISTALQLARRADLLGQELLKSMK